MSLERRVLIVGAGMGGLAAAAALAARGFAVTSLEAAERPGGKMREVEVGGSMIDVGPTVLTMRWAFDEVFEDAGASLSHQVGLRRIDRIARHAWSDGSRLDLFSEIERSADAIALFAGAREAEGYRRFCARAQGIYETLRDSFIRASRPGPLALTRRVGVTRLPDLIRISPFTTMWRALEGYFVDPRLRQLFGRYATYCGSSPFLAPATLMLVAHVEREGVWVVDGGMARLAEALCDLARSRGAVFRFGRRVTRIVVENGRAAGVETDEGERIFSDAVIWNGDVSALAEAEARGRSGARSQSDSARRTVDVGLDLGHAGATSTVLGSSGTTSSFPPTTGRSSTTFSRASACLARRQSTSAHRIARTRTPPPIQAGPSGSFASSTPPRARAARPSPSPRCNHASKRRSGCSSDAA